MRQLQEVKKEFEGTRTTWRGAASSGPISAAGLSLFLELAVIRWQSAIFELFAFYKNFSLLACFLGLGPGYALSGRRQIPLLLTVTLTAWQIVLFIINAVG